MEPLQNLVDYCCIGRRQEIVAQYNPREDAELQAIAVECLGKMPAFHIQFTHATRERRYCFFMDSGLVFFAIVDEALPKGEVFDFLGQLRDEFFKISKAKGLANRKDETPILMNDDDLSPTFRRLVAPLVGVPYAERGKRGGVEQTQIAGVLHEEAEAEPCSPTAAASALLFDKTVQSDKSSKKSLFPLQPLLPKGPKHEKKKVRDHGTETREIAMENNGKGQKVEVVMADGSSAGEERDGVGSCPSPLSLQRNVSISIRSKGQQIAQRMWWRNVRVVLLLDVIVCAILFAVWLCICRGFECISE